MSAALYPVAIIAGGLATRLRPLTEQIPKALIEIAGEPFIAHQLRLLEAQGVRRAIICAGYKGEMIEAFVGRGDAFGIDVGYSWDGPKLLGTAGALKQALPQLGEKFFTLYGDSYLACDFSRVQQAFDVSGCDALMTVYRNDGQFDRSNVEFVGGRIVKYDKHSQSPRMRHIDYGLGAFRSEVFEALPEGEPWDLAAVYQDALQKGALAACEIAERFYEIGSREGIEELRTLLAEHPQQSHDPHGRRRMDFVEQFLAEATEIIAKLDRAAIQRVADLIAATRAGGGRMFLLGVGGSAANASHAVNDFRKIAGLECYAPTDNVSELTARTNDEGWATIFAAWLKTSRLNSKDMIFVFSVGGGNVEKNVSPNLVAALDYARSVGAKIAGIVGRDGGYTAKTADACVIVPTVNPANTTPHAEAFQAVIWHLLVSHPALKAAETKWESTR